MRVLFKINDRMEDELESICQKDEMTSMDLENVYKIVDIIKDITTIDAMHKSEHSGRSRGWDDDYTYARNRDSSKDDVIDNLTRMMRNARTDEERESYRKTIEQLSR